MYAGEVDRTGVMIVAGQTYTINQSAYGRVENVQASDGETSQGVSISWNLKEDATSYKIYRSEFDDVETAVVLVSTAGNFYTDTTVLLGHIYYYWVRPVNAGGICGFGLSDSGFIKIAVSQDWKDLHYPAGYPVDDSDTDGDGFTAIEEYIAGTIPTNGASFFKIQMQKGAGDWLDFTVDMALEQRVYAVHWKNTLEAADWVQQGDGVVGTNGPLTISIQSDGASGFFMQRVYPEPQ